MQQAWGRVKLTEVNPHLVCVLCHGYFIDATTMVECPHSFCRSCIILYLETKSYCPICEVQIHKTKPHLNLKPDKTLQDIVYKLVPGLFHSEMRRRREFYAKHPNHDLYLNPEARGVGVERIIYSPEDSISLSLEYYDDEREREEWTSTQPGLGDIEKKSSNRPADGLKRYLQCPAVVTMSQIKKFIRMKYNLAASCSVEVLYRRESLPDSYSLMDVAYIYTWKRNGPMRFYYRIHVAVSVTHTIPSSENPSVTEISEEVDSQTETSNTNETNLDTHTNSELKSLFTVGSNEGASVFRKEEERNLSKDENSPAITRPYASEHDELSVSLLLSLSNGHHRETKPSVEQKTDDGSEHGVVSSTKMLNSVNHQIPTEHNSKSAETNVNESKVVSAVPSVSSASPVNGYTYNQQIKSNVSSVNGSTKPVAKKPLTKCFVKPPVKVNLGVKNNGQIIKNILANKLTDNKNLAKPIQNQSEGNFNNFCNKEQNKIHEENKSNPDVQTACQISSPKHPHSLVGKYMTSQLVKNSSRKIESVKNTVIPQKTEPKPEGTTNAAINNSTPENKRGSGITHNNQDKTAMKATEPVPNSVQPIHRKEVNRLEQIVKNCMKKGNNSLMLNKPSESKLSNGDNLKVDTQEECIKQTAVQNTLSRDHRLSGSVNVSNKEIDKSKEETSILKRKLNDPTCLISVNRDSPNLLGPPDSKKRRLVTPDVSIELTTHPAHDNKKNPLKRPTECSDLSILTKRFLDSIQQMKKHASVTQEFNIKDIDQLCASNVKIEKIPASHLSSGSNKTLTSRPTSGKSEEKGKQIGISEKTNTDNPKHKKKDDLVSIAIERINENIRMSEKSNEDHNVSTETHEHKDHIASTEHKELVNPEPVPSTSGDKESLPSPSSLKKLPRLIEINAPPRPKLQSSLQDPKLRTGLKMTTVRKEVPIGKESPLVWKDNTGALDLSSGSPKNKPAANPRPSSSSKSPSSLSPLQAMSSFQVPDMKASPSLRIPNLKHKTPPHLQPRPSSLSSSSPSPPADSRTAEMFSNTAYQQLYRHQLELQSRLMASSQVNNNKWRQDPLSAKKFEEWMRNMINCGGLPPHPLMFQSQLGSAPDTLRK